MEEVKMSASIDLISAGGEVFIDFKPGIAVVPTDWDRLWDLEEREKLSPADREAFEEQLIKIMHV